MPFELGMFLAAKKFGGKEQVRKRVLIFDTEQYRYQRFISDLNGMDIAAHGNDPSAIAGGVRNWLANVTRRRLIGAAIVVGAFEQFTQELPELALAAGFDPDAIPYVDFEFLVTDWLLSAEIGQ